MDIKAKTIRSLTAASWTHLVAKGIDVSKTIILARLLVPEDFGVVALALLVTESLSQIGSAGLFEAVIQKKDADERTIQAGFTFNLISSVLLFGVVWATADLYESIYDSKGVEIALKVLSVCIISRGLGFLPEAILVKQLDFRERVIVGLIASGSGAVCAIALALLGFGYWSIVAGLLARALVDLGLLFTVRPARVKFVFDVTIARGLFSFGMQVVLTSILAFLVYRLPDAIIGGVLGTGALGYYVLAFRWGNIVAVDMAQVLGKVLYPAFALVQKQAEKVRWGYLQALKYLSVAIFPFSLGMAAVAPEFVPVVLGEKWHLTVVPLQILCFAGLLRSLGFVGGAARRAVGRPEMTNYLLAMQLILMVVLLIPLTYWNGLMGASLAVAVTSVGVTAGVVYVDGRLFDMQIRDLFGVVKHPFWGSLIMVVLISVERVIFEETNKVMALVTFISTGMVSYGVYMVWSSPEVCGQSVRFLLEELSRAWGEWKGEIST